MKLGSAMVDEVCRRIQQETLGHRGRKGDPLYGIRRTLQIGAEHLTEKQACRLDAKLILGDPDHVVTLAWQCYQKPRHIHHSRPEKDRQLVNEVIASFPSCPIPEVSQLGRTLKQWKAALLAYFDSFGDSNGPTEAIGTAINGVIETTRRIARGFRNFTNYRLRCLLAAGGHRPYRINKTNLPKCEGPFSGSGSTWPPSFKSPTCAPWRSLVPIPRRPRMSPLSWAASPPNWPPTRSELINMGLPYTPAHGYAGFAVPHFDRFML